MSEREQVWEQQLLSKVFRIGRVQVLPSQHPKTQFVHYSIPAWDEFGGPIIELGEAIESNKIEVNEPSILVSKLNPRKPRVVIVESPEGQTCCSTEFICYQPKSPDENLRFWGAYFYSAEFSARLARVAIGSTNSHTRAAPRETLDWLVPSVPSTEQETIAQILDTLDTAIHKTEALIQKLKAVKQGLLHDLLTRGIEANGQLRPPQSEAPQLYKESPLGWIPKEWRQGKLEDWLIGKPKNGYSPQEAREWTNIQMLGLSCLTREGFAPIQLKPAPSGDKGLDRVLLNDGDLLISRANTRELVGLVGIYHNVGTPCTYPDLMMRLIPSEEATAEFLQLILQSKKVRRQIQAAASGTSESMVKINAFTVAGLEVAIPNIKEQAAILCYVRASDAQLQSEQEGVKRLRTLKSGLMNDLLTGRVRVTSLLEGAASP